ncbi:MAG TPA: serine/threonine protein kinase, partial [Microcella sp.]|nr:serine/threonine protein kinase [Microcella sp.]
QINDAPPELPASVPEPVRNLVMAAIAKKPADRPASAQHFARAAQALRRGDVGGAAAIVPAIAGAPATQLLDATRVMPSAAGNDEVTRVMPSMAAGAAAGAAAANAQAAKKKRSPWTWPLIALIGLLVVLIVGAIIAVLAQPSDDPGEIPASPTVTASDEPSPDPSETVEEIRLTEDQVLNRTQQEVDDILTELGLVLDAQQGNPAPSPDQVDRSYRVNPTGLVEEGDVITVFFYTPVETPPQPNNLAINPGSGPYLGGSTVTLSWPSYTSCPAGFTLSGYNVTIVGGSPAQANPIPAGTNNLDVELADGGQLRVTYIALCGDLQSERSNELAVPITAAPVPTPTPTPTPSTSPSAPPADEG